MNEKLASRDWDALGRIEQQVNRSREQSGGPEPERFAREHPEAVVYDAVIVVAQQQALDERQQAADPPAPDLSAPAADLSPPAADLSPPGLDFGA